MRPIIKECDCKNEYQDQKYGKGNRVHNISGLDEKKASCTVFGVNEFDKEIEPIGKDCNQTHPQTGKITVWKSI